MAYPNSIQWKDGPWHFVICQLAQVGRAERAAVTDDDPVRNGREGGPEMLLLFESHDTVLRRINAKGAELLQVQHFAGVGHDQHIDPRHMRNRRHPHAVCRPRMIPPNG